MTRAWKVTQQSKGSHSRIAHSCPLNSASLMGMLAHKEYQHALRPTIGAKGLIHVLQQTATWPHAQGNTCNHREPLLLTTAKCNATNCL